MSKVELRADMTLEIEDVEGHPFGFVLHPGKYSRACAGQRVNAVTGEEQMPWCLRASSAKEKQEWMERLRKASQKKSCLSFIT
jgi:hypothetical protein